MEMIMAGSQKRIVGGTVPHVNDVRGWSFETRTERLAFMDLASPCPEPSQR
jgi:hypothetical protein